MSELLETQSALLHSVAKALDNFKKLGRSNYTAAKIRSRMTSLKDTWNKCLMGHGALLHTYPESKRQSISYFVEKQLDTHEELYQTTLDVMAEWLEELEPCVSPNKSFEQSSFTARTEGSA